MFSNLFLLCTFTELITSDSESKRTRQNENHARLRLHVDYTLSILNLLCSPVTVTASRYTAVLRVVTQRSFLTFVERSVA